MQTVELCAATDTNSCLEDAYAYAHCSSGLGEAACCEAGCDYCATCGPPGACALRGNNGKVNECASSCPTAASMPECCTAGCSLCYGGCSAIPCADDLCLPQVQSSVCSAQSTLSACCAAGCLLCSSGACVNAATQCNNPAAIVGCPSDSYARIGVHKKVAITSRTVLATYT
jgi:hypothetical protein